MAYCNKRRERPQQATRQLSSACWTERPLYKGSDVIININITLSMHIMYQLIILICIYIYVCKWLSSYTGECEKGYFVPNISQLFRTFIPKSSVRSSLSQQAICQEELLDYRKLSVQLFNKRSPKNWLWDVLGASVFHPSLPACTHSEDHQPSAEWRPVLSCVSTWKTDSGTHG